MKKRFIILILLVILVLVASYLRLHQLDLTEIGTDEVRELAIANNIVDNKEMYLGGVPHGATHASTTFGPLLFYLLAIPTLFSKNPVFISGFVALLNIFAVLLCYKFAKDFFNVKVGLISAALFAVCPWAVYYSRFIWNPTLIPIFVLIFFYSVYAIAIKDKQKYIVPMFFAFACLLHLHLSTISLVIFLPLVFLFKRKKIKFNYVLVGVILFLLLMLPFIYLNVSSNFEPLGGIWSYGSSSHSEQPVMTNVLESAGMPVMLATNYFGKYMFGDTVLFSAFADNLFLISAIFGIMLFLFSFAFVFKKTLQSKSLEFRKYLFLLLWFIVPILFFMFRMRNASPHYFILIYPVQFIMMGVFISHLFKIRLNKNKQIKNILVFSLLLVFIISQIIFSVSFYNSISKEGGTTGAYDIPYKTKENVVKYILEESEEPTILFYKKGNMLVMQYIFSLHSENTTFYNINSIDELKQYEDAYLILDRYSVYGAKSRLTAEENKYFDQLDKINIDKMEVIKL